ncbi:MAG: amidase domain-containing protein [Oscillospiraceae bacterium]|nr:amidase domain-containing protein [Oscillospiraceae bacterium]
MSFNIKPFDRQAAVEYAHTWAFRRNPRYGDFSEMGGDCTNFISQALIAGGAVMNETRDVGWYYHSLNSRAAAWTSASHLYRFLVNNRGRGPFGHEIPLDEIGPGDIVQLKFAGHDDYSHSLMVVDAGEPAAPDNILIAAHSYDSDDRPLDTYSFVSARGIRIDGVRV